MVNIKFVPRLQERVHDTVLQIQTLERDVSELKREKQELLADLDAVKLEKNHLQTVLETALDEKKRLNDRINQFTIIGMLKTKFYFRIIVCINQFLMTVTFLKVLLFDIFGYGFIIFMKNF